MTAPLWLVVVRVHADGISPATAFEVTSALAPAPMPGDVIRYGASVELKVISRVVGVGVNARPIVNTELERGTVEDLERLRFRRLR